jgi:pimeloyl-ACP methyl ester carboxylesterase
VEEDVAKLSGMMPNAIRVNFEDAGHLIPMERPEEFTNVLLKFLRTH